MASMGYEYIEVRKYNGKTKQPSYIVCGCPNTAADVAEVVASIEGIDTEYVPGERMITFKVAPDFKHKLKRSVVPMTLCSQSYCEGMNKDSWAFSSGNHVINAWVSGGDKARGILAESYIMARRF